MRFCVCAFLCFFSCFSTTIARTEPRDTLQYHKKLKSLPLTPDILAHAIQGKNDHYHASYRYAYPHLYYVQEKLEEQGLTDNPIYCLSLEKLGEIHYRIDDFETALNIFNIWLTKNNKIANQIYVAYNTLGLIHKKMNESSKAEKYFKMALHFAIKQNDAVWAGIIYSNLGNLYFKKGQYKKTKSYVRKEIEVTPSDNCGSTNISRCYCILAEIALIEDSVTLANKYLDSAYYYFNCAKFETSIYFHDVKSKYFSKINKIDSVLYHLDLKDSREQTFEHSQVLFFNEIIQLKESISQARIKIDADKYSNNLRIYRVSNIVLFLLGTISVVMFLFVLYRYYNNQRLEKIKNQQVEKELAKQKDTIEQLIENIKDKSNLINSLELMNDRVLEKKKSENKSEDDDTLSQKLSDARIHTEEAWKDFKNTFTQVYPNFIAELQNRNPSITTGEIRMACLLRLNLNTNHMATMLGVSQDSVKKNLLRLKNKLEFNTQKELKDFISKIDSLP